MRDERELDLPMQSIDCMVSQRLIESEDFSLDSQIMHAASSQPEGLGWPGHSISPPAAYHSSHALDPETLPEERAASPPEEESQESYGGSIPDCRSPGTPDL